MQQITVRAINKGGLDIVLSIVYGENWWSLREQLWQDLKTIHHVHDHKPWAIIGDFNTTRFLDEILGGGRLTYAKIASFNQFIDDCSLSDIKSSGNYWSWHNNYRRNGTILVRLDRVLCNVLINTIPESNYEYHPHATSDHAPMWLQINPAIKGGP